MSTTVSRATWLLAAVFCILIPSTNAFPVNLADAAQPGQVSFTVGSNVYFMNATYDMAPTGRIEFTIGSSSYIIDPDSNTISDTSTGGKRWTLLALFAVLVCFRATIAVLRSSWREDFRKEWLAEQNGNRLLHRELDTVARVWELPKRMVRIEEVAESPPPANGTAHLQVPGPSLSEGAVKTCSGCNGAGTKTMIRQMGRMIQQFPTVCPDCQGEGENIRDKDQCKRCSGKPYSDQEKQSEQ